MVEGVSEEVDVAALPSGLGQDLHDASPQSLVVVGDHELDAAKAALFEGEKEIPPAGLAPAAGELDPEDLEVTVLVDADRHQDSLASNDAAFSHPFVAGIEDEVGVGFVEMAVSELVEALI